jgi:ribosome-binding protein aMBF1 (putative translation factor)
MSEELMQVTLSVDVPHLGTRIKAAREKSGMSPTKIAAWPTCLRLTSTD